MQHILKNGNAHTCRHFDFQNAPQVFKLCNGLYTRNVQGGPYFDKYSNKLGYPSHPSSPPTQKGKQKGKKDHHGRKQVEIRAILD
jgi:hypothetical protein